MNNDKTLAEFDDFYRTKLKLLLFEEYRFLLIN